MRKIWAVIDYLFFWALGTLVVGGIVAPIAILGCVWRLAHISFLMGFDLATALMDAIETRFKSMAAKS